MVNVTFVQRVYVASCPVVVSCVFIDAIQSVILLKYGHS